MAEELRIGVIGAGGRGGLAHHAHKPDEGVRVVAGVDIRPAALERFRELYGPDAFVSADYRELLARDDVDAVFVTSPGATGSCRPPGRPGCGSTSATICDTSPSCGR